MDAMLQDLRYALRTLRRSPGLAVAAILTLGLGIGATTTIFTWMDGLVLRPFPEVRETERLVRVHTRNEAGEKRTVSYPDFRDWREQARSLEGMAAYAMDEFGLQHPQRDGPAERVWGVYASADYFRALGARPLLGRAFSAEEASTPGGARVAVVNQAFADRFWPGEDPIGQRVVAASRWLTVVGIARDGRYDSLTDPTPPFLYVPFAQWYSPEVTLHLRAEGDPKALIGLGLGAVGAFPAARLLAGQLYGVAPGDPATFGAAALLLTGVALLASWLPARRAGRVDPMVALRTE